MGGASGPVHVSAALSELIQRRGYARSRGQVQLRSMWAEIVGSEIAKQTKAVKINRGVLQVEVANSALLSELAAFRRVSLLGEIRGKHAELKVKDIKFRLNSGVGRK